MAFFKNPMESGKSNYSKAISRLQEGNQEINLTQDTKAEDGRFFVFNMEVSEEEYNQFIDVYNLALEERNKSHEMAQEDSEDLKEAA